MAKVKENKTSEQPAEDEGVTNQDENVNPYEGMTPQEILAAAKAEAEAIIAEARTKTTTEKKTRTPRAPKAEPVILTAEQIEAAAEEKAANELRLNELRAELTTVTARADEIKAEIKGLSGKAVIARGPTGVGAFIKSLIVEGLTNDEIMARVAEEWPENRTNVNCINWYRNALKNWPDGKRPVKAKPAEAADDQGLEGEQSEGEGQTDEEAADEAANA
jgi:hypothetical protein